MNEYLLLYIGLGVILYYPLVWALFNSPGSDKRLYSDFYQSLGFKNKFIFMLLSFVLWPILSITVVALFVDGIGEK